MNRELIQNILLAVFALVLVLMGWLLYSQNRTIVEFNDRLNSMSQSMMESSMKMDDAMMKIDGMVDSSIDLQSSATPEGRPSSFCLRNGMGSGYDFTSFRKLSSLTDRQFQKVEIAINEKISEGWSLGEICLNRGPVYGIGEPAVYFSMWSYSDQIEYKDPKYSLPGESGTPLLLGYIGMGYSGDVSEAVFSPEIRVHGGGDVAAITEMWLRRNAETGKTTVMAQSGGGDGPGWWNYIFEFDPSLPDITLVQGCSFFDGESDCEVGN